MISPDDSVRLHVLRAGVTDPNPPIGKQRANLTLMTQLLLEILKLFHIDAFIYIIRATTIRQLISNTSKTKTKEILPILI